MSKVIEGLQDAAAFTKIDALWRRTKRQRGAEVTTYDWGYRDGVMAARALFGKASSVEVPTKTKRKQKRRAP